MLNLIIFKIGYIKNNINLRNRKNKNVSDVQGLQSERLLKEQKLMKNEHLVIQYIVRKVMRESKIRSGIKVLTDKKITHVNLIILFYCNNVQIM